MFTLDRQNAKRSVSGGAKLGKQARLWGIAHLIYDIYIQLGNGAVNGAVYMLHSINRSASAGLELGAEPG